MILEIVIGAPVQEQLYHLVLPVLDRVMQRRLPLAVFDVNVGPMVQQHAGDGFVDDGYVQRRLPVFVRLVDGGAFLQEQFDHAQVQHGHGLHQHRLAARVRVVDVRTVVDFTSNARSAVAHFGHFEETLLLLRAIADVSIRNRHAL